MNKEWTSVFTDTKPELFTTIKSTKILKHLEVTVRPFKQNFTTEPKFNTKSFLKSSGIRFLFWVKPTDMLESILQDVNKI